MVCKKIKSTLTGLHGCFSKLIFQDRTYWEKNLENLKISYSLGMTNKGIEYF